MIRNPFEVLQLGPEATEEAIVQQAGRLRQRATDEATLTAIRQAVQALTGAPEQRQLYAVLTLPNPVYHWPMLARLATAFRRAPASAEEPVPPCPPLERERLAALVRPLVARTLEQGPLPLEMPIVEESAEEIQRQNAEALWQWLLMQPEGLRLAQGKDCTSKT